MSLAGMEAAISGTGCCLAERAHPAVIAPRRLGSAAPATPYCSSVTFSIQVTLLPSVAPVRARWVIALVGEAPCQCFTPGGHCTTSPGWISCTGLPQNQPLEPGCPRG